MWLQLSDYKAGVGRIARKKHSVSGFLEIDITDLKADVRKKIREGNNTSLLSRLIKIIGDTVSVHKDVHACRIRRKLILFDTADISVPLERTVGETKVPLTLLVRRTDRKTAEEIKREIDEALGQEIRSEKDYVLNNDKSRMLMGLFYRMPQMFRMIFWKSLLKHPFRMKNTMGTVMVTNIGLPGSVPGWILPKTIHNLCFGIGTIVKKPWNYRGDIVLRDILHLTVIFDHDIVDGAPAARFIQDLVRHLENPE